MTNATEARAYAYRIHGLQIIEMPTMPFEQTWTVHRELDIITILAGLPEHDRRRALAEALTELIAGDQS